VDIQEDKQNLEEMHKLDRNNIEEMQKWYYT
jgi:hypothetical protein